MQNGETVLPRRVGGSDVSTVAKIASDLFELESI